VERQTRNRAHRVVTHPNRNADPPAKKGTGLRGGSATLRGTAVLCFFDVVFKVREDLFFFDESDFPREDDMLFRRGFDLYVTAACKLMETVTAFPVHVWFESLRSQLAHLKCLFLSLTFPHDGSLNCPATTQAS
jgi:hypothetical protein